MKNGESCKHWGFVSQGQRCGETGASPPHRKQTKSGDALPRAVCKHSSPANTQPGQETMEKRTAIASPRGTSIHIHES
eukprot:1156180-Alexandrium_andersonii.AAC.1